LKAKAADRGGPPMVRSVRPNEPKDALKTLIPIVPDPRKGEARSKAASPELFWMNYYRTHEEKADDLREKIAALNAVRKFRDVQAILVGFLTYHAKKQGEPWMYSALALAFKETQRNDADVKTALNYAADLAVRSHNPNHLVSVADQMVLLGYLDRVGPLLDQAADLVPHRAEPLYMSINLAQKNRDPKRMGEAVDRLLALGWPGDPGFDDSVRREARRQVEALAKSLREEGKADEADALLQRLTDSEARDLYIRLTWTGEADLDLVVEDPLGVKTQVSTPRTVGGGSIVQNGYGAHPTEVFVCPRGFNGEYTVRIETIANDEKNPARSATLEMITHEGTPREHKETRTISLDGSKPPAPVKLTLQGGRRTKALPYVLPSVFLSPEAAGLTNRKKAKKGTADAPKPADRPAAPATAGPTPPRGGAGVR
jgi:hypothetical protein